MLRQIFIELIKKYSGSDGLAETLWDEIEKKYTDKKRHYHSFSHLENLYAQLTEVKDEIEDWDTILFTLFYHDIIYNPAKNNNEEKSAELAKKRLESIKYPADKISKCITQILATKNHSSGTSKDTNLFTDADLSIFGQPWDIYSDYLKKVRKEYSLYPDFIYNPGRKKVLNHFLDMDFIFKTRHFRSKYENLARVNLLKELKQF